MIEPTESESRAELDRFCLALVSKYLEILCNMVITIISDEDHKLFCNLQYLQQFQIVPESLEIYE